MSRYIVVQYLPDPVADERINIGLIAWGDGRVASEFLHNWKRVRAFTGRPVTFLLDAVEHLRSAISPELLLPLDGVGGARMPEEEIIAVMSRWSHSIRITPVRGSTLKPEELIRQLSPKFLKTAASAQRGPDRRTAAALAAEGVKAALTELRLPTRDLLQRRVRVRGEIVTHQFEVGVMNGELWLAADGLAFTGNDHNAIAKDVDALAFRVSDVRERFPSLPLGIVVIPPRLGSPEYDRARDILTPLKAEVLVRDRVREWAQRIIENHVN